MGNSIVSLQGVTQKHGQRILAATQEAAALTVLLSAFGRQQVIAPAVLDLSVVVHSYGRVLRSRVPENLQLALSRTRTPPANICADRMRVAQIWQFRYRVYEPAIEPRESGPFVEAV